MGKCLNILFRCDGSVEIGMGHVVRCLALADDLKENHDCNLHFAMRTSELGISKVKKSYPVLQSDEETFDYEKWLTDCVQKTETKILIMDMRDGLTKTQLNKIKKKTGIRVITIDDPEDKRLESDLAFYPPVPQLDKINWDGFNGKLYIGWEFVILRKEFFKKYPKPNNPIPNILVFMGGTDEKNMTGFVIDILNQINKKFKVIIIVGSGYHYLEILKDRLNLVKYKYELHQNPENIADIMAQKDFAIISFGQTAYELASLKIPALYLCLTEDHNNSAQLFVNENYGRSLGIYDEINNSNLIENISKYLSDHKIHNQSFITNSFHNSTSIISSAIIGSMS